MILDAQELCEGFEEKVEGSKRIIKTGIENGNTNW